MHESGSGGGLRVDFGNQIHFHEGDAGGVIGAGDVEAVGAGFELDEKGGVLAGVGEGGEADLGGRGGEERGGGG